MKRPQERGLSAGDVARRLGVAVTTVRSWDRRYGLGPAWREPGRHRRYDEQDVARLHLMRQLTNNGVAAAEAAKLVRDMPDPGQLTRDATPRSTPDPGTAARAGGLRQAAVALDISEVDRLLRDALATGVVGAWTELICPALRDIGRRHAATGRFVEAEHLLSAAVSAALSRTPRPIGPARVLLACAPDEQHTLALEALAAALAEQGVACRMLGARVPTRALHDAMARTGPHAVLLWAQTPGAADRRQLRAALNARPRPLVVAACGPGWTTERRTPGALSATDLQQAVELLTQLR